MRKIDLDQLKFWSTQNGPSMSKAISKLVTRTGIGFYTLRRVFQGKRDPSYSEQLALCEGTGLSMDQLFPVVENKKESA